MFLYYQHNIKSNYKKMMNQIYNTSYCSKDEDKNLIGLINISYTNKFIYIEEKMKHAVQAVT